jgi:ERCC4-related helicase
VVVRGEEWLVRSSVPVSTGGYAVRTTGMSELVRNHESIFLTALDTVTEMRPEDTKLVQDTTPQFRRSRLFLESLLRRTPPTDDRIYLGHKAAMNPANYQMVPASMALAALRPRILIADGVGIGKTLEVGVILSELIKRGRGERILVVALKSLLTQFQQEMWARFSIPLVRLDSVGLQRVRAKIPANKNPFYYFNRAIISIDTLKNDGRYRTYLEQCRWDAIVIDECHHVANADTQRNRLASLLARTCDSLILTSATPHNGKPESFANLMNMLEPTAIADPTSYTKDEIKGLFVRRFKKDVEDEVGEHFRDRETKVRSVFATDKEERVLRRLKGLKFHTLDKKGAQGKDMLFKTTLLKALLSSPEACLETIQNRLKTIEGKLDSRPTNRENLENDQQVLDMLRDDVTEIVGAEYSKLLELCEYLDSIGWTGKGDSPRVIVFSERIKTLEVLQEHLTRRYSLKNAVVNVFHAGLPDVEQMQIVEDFGKQDSPVRILIASDVASEGVNLHYYCNHLVHFDIPWSLITMEQRNGRIDRYGQNKTPNITYLLTRSDDPEIKGDLRIIEILIKKEDWAHKNIGDAATILALHSPQQEEEYIQGELSFGTDPEEIIPDMPKEEGFLSLLMESEAVPPARDATGQTVSLYPDDMTFVRAAFDEAKEADPNLQYPDIHPEQPSLTFVAPEDLRRRCQFIPREAIPNQWEFLLTADRERVQRAISDARKLAKQDEPVWPEYQLLWELHPVMQWLLDKVTCRFLRHEAPLVLTPKLGPGEAAYLFQGVVSNKRSQPVIVDWFAIPQKGTTLEPALSLDELLQRTGLGQGLSNSGQPSKHVVSLQERLPSVVKAAVSHMKHLSVKRTQGVQKRLDEDNRRFALWQKISLAKVKKQEDERRMASGKVPRDIAERCDRQRRHVEKLSQQRQEWLEHTLEVVDTPFLRLAAVFVGE